MIDQDNKSATEFDMIGEIEVTMGQLMGATKQMFQGQLKHNGKNTGTIIVRSQTLASASNLVA